MQPYDENEETTYVDRALLLTESCVKQWLLVPILSLLTLLAFPFVVADDNLTFEKGSQSALRKTDPKPQVVFCWLL